VFSLCIYQYVQSESTAKNQVDHQHKHLEKLKELNEKRDEKQMSNSKFISLSQKVKTNVCFIHLVYSSSKANDFLSYDKCMQRMKCPVSRKEECSEECHAGRHSHTFSFFNYLFFFLFIMLFIHDR
jgi:hypothetical protein